MKLIGSIFAALSSPVFVPPRRKFLDDDVTISVSKAISKKCQISVNIVLVLDRFNKSISYLFSRQNDIGLRDLACSVVVVLVLESKRV